MRYSDFNTYIRGRLPAELVRDLKTHFEDLEPDVIDYKRNGFQSRSRRFGAFAFDGGDFRHDPSSRRHFNKPKCFHARYDECQPAHLTEGSLVTGVYGALLQAVLATSPIKRGNDYLFGVNLVRVRADDEHMGAPAPGLHQDGYDYSCHINVSRENVSGGTSILAVAPSPDTVVVECNLTPGEFVFFNDRTMYHTASPVTPRCGGHRTWRDMVIVDVLSHRWCTASAARSLDDGEARASDAG
jgi:hypothetical protein